MRIVKDSDFAKGQKLIVISDIRDNIGQWIRQGSTVTVSAVDEDGGAVLLSNPSHGFTWFYLDSRGRQFMHGVPSSSGKLALPEEKVSGEIASKPVRYMYVITDENGFIDATPDRDEARETKALFGGKREGVIITAYAPVKEIR